MPVVLTQVDLLNPATMSSLGYRDFKVTENSNYSGAVKFYSKPVHVFKSGGKKQLKTDINVFEFDSFAVAVASFTVKGVSKPVEFKLQFTDTKDLEDFESYVQDAK